ncbi:ABC transporter permease [Streptomyces sp. SKN60]|uniref:ABC transporter permease n=1 Tax=Streptomyces sp. SKN60 TaxID=2855506 RepID=UPI002246D227|nr:ABC transporter permease [Streptomyces sp. SKN60]MCX2184147.1 ABC transporter permease [Streptomyces sp. SKN60]
MSVISETRTPGRSDAVRPTCKVTGARVLRAEWAKLWSLRSTWITFGVALLFLLGFGLIAAARYEPATAGTMGPPGGHMDLSRANAVDLALFGVGFAQLALGILGVLVTAGEYSTGTIRSTLAAVPRRLPVLWSKAAVHGVVALLVGTAGVFAAFKAGGHMIVGTPAELALSDTGVLRSLLAAGLYLGMIGVIGVALGALLRSTAGAVAVLVAALLLVPGLVSLLPSSWESDVSRYLPSNAGESMFALKQAADTLTPGAGLAVLTSWTLLALAGAAWRLKRGDA